MLSRTTSSRRRTATRSSCRRRTWCSAVLHDRERVNGLVKQLLLRRHRGARAYESRVADLQHGESPHRRARQGRERRAGPEAPTGGDDIGRACCSKCCRRACPSTSSTRHDQEGDLGRDQRLLPHLGLKETVSRRPADVHGFHYATAPACRSRGRHDRPEQKDGSRCAEREVKEIQEHTRRSRHNGERYNKVVDIVAHQRPVAKAMMENSAARTSRRPTAARCGRSRSTPST